MRLSRRRFLRTAAAAGAGLLSCPRGAAATRIPFAESEPLSARFADLPRHFIFEYYPWYSTSPWGHWDAANRRPPIDIASNYMPALGPYDSHARPIIEQHAKWIRQTGAGAIDISWWGRDGNPDRAVHALMDVMAYHDIHATFHLEPYGRSRAAGFARDIEHLIREFGDRRRWDCLLLLADADGTSGPVFKTFSTIELPESTDCHGNTRPIPDYVRDSVWRAQTDRVRETFAADFDHVTLLCDCTAVDRVAAAGFDGFAIYDPFVAPDTWPIHARNASGAGQLFSFNINPGFDGVVERQSPDDCYRPPPFEPGGAVYNWTQREDRNAAYEKGAARVAESLAQTVALQTSPAFGNAERGFFLAFINSFNEWHEGTQFEPMRPRGGLSAEELAVGYHNHDCGTCRLDQLGYLLADVLRTPDRALRRAG